MSNTVKMIASIASVFLLSMAIFGQVTTGSIEGTVKDSAGAVVPGATVTVTGVTTGFNQTQQTNSDGYYFIDRVPAGTYKVVVAPISGFAEASVETRVAIEKSSRTDITLGAGSVGATVDVTADPLGVVVDATDSKNQTNVTAELIDSLPLGTNFSSVLKLNPATRGESLTGGFTIGGASKAENTFSIDGQDVTNVRNGTLNDNSTGVDAYNIPTALIKEVQIKTSGFEAEHGGASGGVVQVSTKSGTNEFHGEAGAQFNSSRLQPNNSSSVAQNAFDYGFTTQRLFALPATPKDASLAFDPTLALGGPIFKDRLWFFGAYSPQVFTSQRTVGYYTINQFGGLELDPLTGVNKPRENFQTYQIKQRYEYANVKLDYSLPGNLSGFTSYLWNPLIQEGQFPYGAYAINAIEPFGNGLRGPDYMLTRGGYSMSNVFNTQMTWAPLNWFALSGRFGHGFQNSKPGSYGTQGGLQYACAGTSAAFAYANGTSGCTFGFLNQYSRGGITRNVSKHKTLNIDPTFIFNGFGRHNLKAGYERSQIDVDVLETGTRNDISLRYGQANANAGPFCNTAASIITATNPGGTCLGFGVYTVFGEGGKGGNLVQAFYVQDKWQLFDRLTLNLGVRTETENLPSFSTLTANTNPIKIPYSKKTVPRLGFAFDPTGSGKSRIYGSYGVFTDRMKFELPIGSFGGAQFFQAIFPIRPNMPAYSSYNFQNLYGNWNPQNSGNPSTQGGIATFHRNLRPDSSVSACGNATTGVTTGGSCSELGLTGITLLGVDPDLKPFKQREFSLGYETELWKEYVFNVNYNRRDVISTVDDIGYDHDHFYTIGNPGEGVAAQYLQALGYPPAAPLQREYNAVEFSFTKRFSRNYFFSANYTWSRLFGNYSGLANSDYFDGGSLSGNVADRSDPGVNRFYDWSLAGYSAQGGSDAGVLATDRTHVFKAYGGYAFDWFGSKANETMLSFFQVVQSGTPQTTAVEAIEGSGMYLVYTKRGDLGRTPTFTQTDLTASHTYKFGRDDRFRLVGDITVNNAFNQRQVIAINPRRFIQDGPADPFAGAGTFAQNVAFERSVATGGQAALYNALNCNTAATCTAAGVTPNTSNGSNLNLLYGLPSAHQAKRNIRFGFRLVF
jgi:hypothetical protein